MSKGGTFVGSNKLKHMTTSMMNIAFEGSESNGRRYMEFTKNRLGQVGKKLYFDLANGVSFDEARYAGYFPGIFGCSLSECGKGP